MLKLVKPLLIFLVLLAVFSAGFSENMDAALGGNGNYVVGMISAIVAVWLVGRVHISVVAILLIATIGFNMPKESSMDTQFILVSLVSIVGVWIARYLSRIAAFLVLALGIGVTLPTSLGQGVEEHVDSNILMASLCAVLLTPLIDILTTRRNRASSHKLSELIYNPEEEGKGGKKPQPPKGNH